MKKYNYRKYELLDKGIHPIDEDEFTLEYLNENFEEVRTMAGSFRQGDVIREMDEMAFNQVRNNLLDTLIRDEVLTEIDGDYYLVEKLEDLD